MCKRLLLPFFKKELGSKYDHDLKALINHYAFLAVKTTKRESNTIRIVKKNNTILNKYSMLHKYMD